MNSMKKKFIYTTFLLFFCFLLFYNPVYAASLAKPTLVKVTSVGYNSVKLTWKMVKGANGYVIYRKTGSGSYKKIAKVSKNTTTTYTDKSLKCGTVYTYTVAAYKTQDGRTTTGAYNKTGIKGKPVPAKPTSLKASITSSSIKLTWKKVAGASGYIILKSTNNGTSFTAIKTQSGNTNTTYTDYSIKMNKKYIYKVKAYRTVNSKKIKGKVSAAISGTVTGNSNTVTTSYTDFGKATTPLITSATIPGSIAAAEADEFLSCRIIVKGKTSGITFDQYNPKTVVEGPDNYYVVSAEKFKIKKITLLHSKARKCHSVP